MPKSRNECLHQLRETHHTLVPGQAVQVGLFQPEDAEGIARLYFTVYGDTFPLDYVYDPARIIAANAGPDLYQYVGRTGSGDVVGVSALFRAAPNERILESGGMIVHPAYRNGFLAVRLSEATLGTLPEALHLHAVFGQAVCDHTTTQKLVRKYGYSVFALEMESMPGKPETSTQQATGPISLLNVFRICSDQPHGIILPEAYADWLRQLYVDRGLSRSYADPQPPHGTSACTTQDMDHAGLAKLILSRIGADFSIALQQFEQERAGCRNRHLLLPLTDPGVDTAVKAARQQGYFLGGLLPLWTGSDVLLLQKTAQQPDWERPKLLTQESRALLEEIRQDWSAVLRQA